VRTFLVHGIFPIGGAAWCVIMEAAGHHGHYLATFVVCGIILFAFQEGWWLLFGVHGEKLR
jgi:hypothetical protein